MALIDDITKLLGNDTDALLKFSTPKVSKSQLHLPGPDWVDRMFAPSDRPTPVLRSLQALFDEIPNVCHARLPSCGHLAFVTKPDLILKAVTQFLNA